RRELRPAAMGPRAARRRGWAAHGGDAGEGVRAVPRGHAVSPAPRKLGSAGPPVFPLPPGCMGMAGWYGPADERESIATIHDALDRGVNLLDTGDYYSFGKNEMLIGRALQGRRDKAMISVKFGGMRSPDGGWLGVDARPAAVKNFVG